MSPATPSVRDRLALEEQAAKRLLTPILTRLSLSVVFAALSLFLFVKLAHEVSEADTLRFDRGILAFFHAHQWPPLHAALRLISQLAGPICQTCVTVTIIAFFAVKRRFVPDGLAMLIAGVGGTLLMMGLKRLFHRPRPEAIFDQLGFSFPSGHSFFALVVYGMVAYWVARDLPPRRRALVWTLALTGIFLVGFSRVFLGEHFPSDVIAGFAVGIPWLWGCLALPDVLQKRAEGEPHAKTQRRKGGEEKKSGNAPPPNPLLRKEGEPKKRAPTMDVCITRLSSPVPPPSEGGG